VLQFFFFLFIFAVGQEEKLGNLCIFGVGVKCLSSWFGFCLAKTEKMRC
jgi:hypothetical protein